MYIEHPFKYNGVYYAKIDGELIEITKEQAKVMLSFYRNSRNYEKRWAPKDSENDKQKNEEVTEECQDLLRELEEEEKRVEPCERIISCSTQKQKRKMILQREMILDCVFSENAEGISMLAEEDQHIIREVYFNDVPQVQVAKGLGITPQALNSRLKYIMVRLRRMYKAD